MIARWGTGRQWGRSVPLGPGEDAVVGGCGETDPHMLAALISHYRWYEVLFDTVVLVTGLALGVTLGLFLLLHHIAAGYTYLRRVSISRTISDSDLWIAFAWGARQHRREAMRDYERTIRPPRGRRGGPRLRRIPGDRPSDDRKTGRAG